MTALSNPRVLIVDDNLAFGENLKEILEAASYQPRLATSVASALETARQGFELALVDLRLPDGDGTHLAESLKAAAPDSAVIMLTGFATLETATAAVRSGAFAYLMKPCSPEQLLLTLGQAMRHVQLQVERREMERRAQMNEKLAAVGTLTAGLSHEIRNPLNSAALQLVVLERRVRGLDAGAQPPLLEPLKLVQGEIRRLERILQDFLQFARPLKLKVAPIALEGLLGRVLDLLEAEVEQQQVRIERQLGPATALGDGDRLQQVLLNLCLNGIQAMSSGGLLTVSTAREGDEAVIRVDDTGPGIPEEARQRLFEPFFTTKPKGTGLGLPIAHAIIDQHHGRILVQSLKQGTRFEVRLPLPRPTGSPD